MKWKDTEKECKFFNYNNFYYFVCNNQVGNPWYNRNWEFYDKGFAYPKKDLSKIQDTFETTTINPDSKLFFDSGSGFPRFKLSITGNKRCIKIPKADHIVVSGNVNYKSGCKNWIVLEDDCIYLIDEDEWNHEFGNLTNFIIKLNSIGVQFSNIKLIYQGRLNSYTKDSVYLAKYANGDYTLPYITDYNLDKIVSGMCPDITYDELMSVLDMLNSEDAAIVQLGVKMIEGWNVEKYKLTLRLILYTRVNWYLFTKNTVGAKQLIETLNLNTYYINNDFAYASSLVDDGKTAYAVEDVALAKQVSSKLIKDWLQNLYNEKILQRGFSWIPDERKIELK